MTGIRTRRVRFDKLQVGDELQQASGHHVFVTDRYDDGPDGLWFEFSDGDCGYITGGAFRVVV